MTPLLEHLQLAALTAVYPWMQDLFAEAAEQLALLQGRNQPCQTCRWWNDGYGMLTTGWKYCDRGGSDDGEPEMADTLAWAADIESYGASLLTHETFGCVQHEPLLGDHGGG
jgi:hypothetical protein